MKLYRYLKKVWSDRQIITHTDMNRIEEGIEAFGNNVSKATVPDIETLKGLKYLAVGDIVQLNGYYQAGDGAGHKRKIEETDDGSGVQLANGLWANIVHNGEVNVSWFGAKGDGVTDDSEFIKKTHNFASLKSLNTKYKKGRYILDVTKLSVKISGEIDFCYSEIIFKISNTPFQPCFYTDTSKYVELSKNLEILKGQNIHFEFSKLKDKFIIVDGNTLGEFGNTFNFEEVFFSLGGGSLDGKSMCNRSMDILTNIRYRDLTNPLVIKNVKITEIYDGGQLDIVEKFNYTLFNIEDVDNLKIKNITYSSNDFVASRSVFFTKKCYNVLFSNIVTEGFYKAGQQQGVNSAYGYTINSVSCIRVLYDRVISPKTTVTAWSTIGCNRLKIVTYRGCSIFTPDQHSLIQDLKVYDSYISRAMLSGDGYRIYDNVSFCPRESGDQNTYSLLKFRGESITGDFSYFDGDIILRDCTLDIPNFLRDKVVQLIELNYPIDKNSKTLSTKFFNKLTVDNLKINCEIVNKEGYTPEAKTIPTFRLFDADMRNSFRTLFKSIIFKNTDLSDVKFQESIVIIDKDSSFMSSLAQLNANGYPMKPNINFEFHNVNFRLSLYEEPENRRGVLVKDTSRDKGYIIPYIKYSGCKNVGQLYYNFQTVEILNSSISHVFSGGELGYENKSKLTINNCELLYWFSFYLSKNSALKENGFTLNKYTNIDNSNMQTEVDLTSKFLDIKNSKAIFRREYGMSFDESEIFPIQQLNTPYHATKMQEEGIYNDFIQYMDEKTEYDRLQRELEQQRQLAFEQRENQEKVYEEWLAEQPMQMSIDVEPVPSEKLLEFKKKYLG